MRQPNNWTCLITSFAIVLKIDVSELIKMVGSDGTEAIWGSKVAERKGHHIQEIIDCCYGLGYDVTPIEYNPIQGCRETLPKILTYNLIKDPLSREHRMQKYLAENDGVITGIFNKKPHAMAWKNGDYFDPGNLGPITSLEIDTFWLLHSKTDSKNS